MKINFKDLNQSDSELILEMANVGSFKGYKIKVFSYNHGIPNFHLIALNGDYEAEFKIPKDIPKSPADFDKLFLGYKKLKKEYSYKELRILIKWMSEKNKIATEMTNFEFIHILSKSLESGK